MTLKHTFVSAVADDAAALAAGEVVPQAHWNADHTVSGTSLQVQYNNAGALTGMTGTLWDNANLLLSVGSSMPTGLRLYNVVDTLAAPTNYERGVFDWTTVANTLTIGTQKSGTGTNRDVAIVAASGNISLFSAVSGAAGSVGILISPWVGGTSHYINSGTDTRLNSVNVLGWSPTNFATTAGDTGISRIAAKVVGFGDDAGVNANGWMQWAGQARVTADFSVTSSTVLVNVTGLSVAVQAGRTYQFEAELYVTDAAAGGVQAAIAGTATATAIQYTGYTIADNAIKAKTNATALATAVASTVTTETSGIIVRITGIITVNAAGTLTVQMAQNTSNATPTIAKRGSWLLVNDMP